MSDGRMRGPLEVFHDGEVVVLRVQRGQHNLDIRIPVHIGDRLADQISEATRSLEGHLMAKMNTGVQRT